MKKTIETINFDASPELVNYIDNLFDDLTTYYDRITSADIYLKRHEEKNEGGYEVEVKLFLPAQDVFLSADGENFNDASTKAYAKAKRQLREVKGMRQTKRVPRIDKEL